MCWQLTMGHKERIQNDPKILGMKNQKDKVVAEAGKKAKKVTDLERS